MIGIFSIIICYFPAKHVTKDARITYRSTHGFKGLVGPMVSMNMYVNAFS